MMATILITSCSSVTSQKSETIPFFPVEKEPGSMVMGGDLRGTLVTDGTYLRVRSEVRLQQPAPTEIIHDTLVIWPYGYSVTTFNRELQVQDAIGRPFGRIGDTVRMGGGNIPRDFAEHVVGYNLPQEFGGGAWRAASNSSDTYIPFQTADCDTNPGSPGQLRGTLLIIDNLVRLKTIGGKTFLPIWPHGYYVFVDGQSWRIYDGQSRPVAWAGSPARPGGNPFAGDNLTLGGGEVSVKAFAECIGLPTLPDSWVGPYWLVSAAVD
jgi:hypothetical protein